MILSGKTAIVTGAAHRVGREIALALAERGCNLVVHFHNSAESATKTAEEARAKGVSVHLHQADLRKYDAIANLFQSLDQEEIELDILINSAAILERVDLLKATEDDWHRTIDLNLKAPFFCIQHAAKRMFDRNGGVIINISDIAGLRPWSQYPTHSISKAGIEMLTQVAALALAPAIRVNGIAPGPVLKPDKMPNSRWQEITGELPLRRGGKPEDVAAAALFLVENEYITGETLVIDGGNQL